MSENTQLHIYPKPRENKVKPEAFSLSYPVLIIKIILNKDFVRGQVYFRRERNPLSQVCRNTDGGYIVHYLESYALKKVADILGNPVRLREAKLKLPIISPLYFIGITATAVIFSFLIRSAIFSE